MIRWIRRRRWVWIPLVILGAVVLLVGRPVFHLMRTVMSDRDQRRPVPAGMADDASRLDAVPVAEIWKMPAGEEAEGELRQLLAQAAEQHLHVSIAGARHSMGGQTIFPGGIQIDMLAHHRMTLDEQTNILDVQAGALWSEVLPYLDGHHWSVAVMQSNNSFSVGGSLSVNCHGWQPGSPPIASTVESLRLMKANGEVVRCSRTENRELFSLVLGGYGLFGIILDARLHVVANERYEMRQYLIPSGGFVSAWDAHVARVPGVGMALGRLSVVPEDFLNQALLYTFTRVPLPSGELPPLTKVGMEGLTRALFRGSVDSDYGKKLRWQAESELATHVAAKFYSRNQLLNEPAENLANRTADSTDILQEYFVPGDRLNDFLAQMRNIIPRNGGNLLNVTVREVQTVPDVFLRYADRDMIALVLLFNQPFAAAAESRMQVLTRQLIDAALAEDGRYYLPYRLAATVEEFAQAYPQAGEFFAAKRRYDPDELFQNEFYVQYGNVHATK